MTPNAAIHLHRPGEKSIIEERWEEAREHKAQQKVLAQTQLKAIGPAGKPRGEWTGKYGRAVCPDVRKNDPGHVRLTKLGRRPVLARMPVSPRLKVPHNPWKGGCATVANGRKAQGPGVGSFATRGCASCLKLTGKISAPSAGAGSQGRAKQDLTSPHEKKKDLLWDQQAREVRYGHGKGLTIGVKKGIAGLGEGTSEKTTQGKRHHYLFGPARGRTTKSEGGSPNQLPDRIVFGGRINSTKLFFQIRNMGRGHGVPEERDWGTGTCGIPARGRHAPEVCGEGRKSRGQD